ncbi:MAG TPA: acyltransferase, partial [Opitutales bacterium]|nr:acyltransferase [Opitutales bacterium]
MNFFKLLAQLPHRFRRVTTVSHHYMPVIDGLRFLAIFGVLIHHTSAVLAYNGFRGYNESRLLQGGHCGVYLFFVISGFILALPFVKQFCQDGKKVSIGPYFLRRLTRLEPPYIVTILLCWALITAWHWPELPEMLNRHVLYALTYSTQLFDTQNNRLNPVIWTLAVEVQFYLCMPIFAQLFRLPA